MVLTTKSLVHKSTVLIKSPGGSTVSYDGGSFGGRFCACSRGISTRRIVADGRGCRRARAVTTLRRRRRRAEVDRRRFRDGGDGGAARRRRSPTTAPRLAGSRRPAVIGGLAVARCRGWRRRATGGLVRFASEVVCLPVTMLAERAAVASAVTATARLVRLATAVPTVLNTHP